MQLQVLLVEAAHTFGMCLLVYRVLPQFDFVRACFLMCTAGVVPALFKLLLTKGNRGVFSVIIDILALLMQCSMFFIVTRYLTRWRTVLLDPVDIVQIVASMVLISVRYWENFIDRDLGALGIQSFKATLRVGRCKTYIFASMWKIGLTLAFAYILVPDMTPMTDLFNNIRNESLFANGSKFLNGEIELLTTPSGLNLSSNLAAYDSVYYNNRVVPRFKRQAPNNSYDYNDQNYLDPTDGGRPRGRRPGAGAPPLPRRPVNYDYGDYGSDVYDYDGGDFDQSGSKEVNKVLWRFLPLIVQALSGAVCYYFARVACKLCMQGFGFSFPLLLITPATACIFSYLCHLEGWTRVILPDLEIGKRHRSPAQQFCFDDYFVVIFRLILRRPCDQRITKSPCVGHGINS